MATKKSAPAASAAKLSKAEAAEYAKLLKFSNFKMTADSLDGKDERTICLAFLAENGVDDVDKEPIKEIFDYCLAFTTSSTPAIDDEEELDELAEEVDEEEETLDEEGDDDEETEPASTTKKAPTPTVKAKVTPAPKAVAKAETKVATSAPKAGFEKFDGRGNKAHASAMKAFLSAWFDFTKEYRLDFLKQGATIRMLLANSEPTIINFDEVKIDVATNKMSGNIYLNRFKSVDDIEPYIDEFVDDKKIGMFRGESHPSIKGVSSDELIKFFNEQPVLTIAKERAQGMDKKTGVNREAMEKKIQEETAAPKAKPAVAAKVSAGVSNAKVAAKPKK